MPHPIEPASPSVVPADQIFQGVSELAHLCREKEWGQTPLGPTERWSASLRAVASLVVGFPTPMVVLWGPQLIQIYNDGYGQLMGEKHPAGLGEPTQACWPEVWAFNAPLYEGVCSRGDAFRFENQRFVIERHGRPEEAFFSLSYSPVVGDEGGVSGVLVTVTETTAEVQRARSQEALRTSEERFRLMADAVPQIVWVTDPQGRVEFFNRQWSDYTGKPYDAELGAKAAEIAAAAVHPDDASITMRRFEAARRSGETFTVEHRIRSAAGDYRWFLVRAEPYRDPATGRISRWFGASVDIHDRKLAEQTLTTAAEINAFRVDLDNALSSLADPAQIQVVATRVLGSHLGASRVLYAEISADNKHVQIDADYCDGVASIVGTHRLTDFGPLIAELRAGRTLIVADAAKDERLSPSEREATAAKGIGAHATVPLLKSGYAGAILVTQQARPRTWTAKDVALMEETAERTWAAVERARAESALRQSEARYRALFETMDQGFGIAEMIFSWDGQPVDFRWTETNPAFKRHTGFAASADKTVRDLIPDLERCWIDAYGRIALSGEPERFIERSNALGRWFEVYAFPIGELEQRRVAVLFTDISERKRAEAALRDADRRKDEFLAMLAHELRNPLAAIANTVKLLERIAEPAATRRHVEILDRQARMLRGLVDDLLDVSRITRGLVELKQEQVELAAVAERALESLHSLLEEKRHEIKVELPSQPLLVTGDAVRLEQILVNLLTNAAKYTDAGGRLCLGLKRHEHSAELTVSDTGIGMTEEVLASIFELFGQAERGLARSEGGLGIGLTIVKNLVELHGGHIEARSAGPGQGAEFVVTLPLAAVEEDLLAEAPLTDAGAVSVKRVLLVEDNADIAETLALLLEEFGHQVMVASDGPSALVTAEAFHPDIALLDIGLPGMDGYELAKHFRQNPQTCNVVLAALTGYGQPSDRERAAKAGFDAHFVKPVGIDILERFVAEAQPR